MLPLRLSYFILLVCFIGCAVGKPPGFSEGDQWTFPLVGPLEDGDLLTPVRVQGKGPFLFKLDPDAKFSAVDAEVVQALNLRGGTVVYLDERDRLANRNLALLPRMEVSNLTVRNFNVLVLPPGQISQGRRIHGIIGADIIAESLVFEVDRDNGLAHLYTHEAWAANRNGRKDLPKAETIRFDNWSGELLRRVQPRRIANARIGGKEVAMHLDLGATLTSLRANKAKDFPTTAISGRGQWVDEVGSRQDVKQVVKVPDVQLGNLSTQQMTILPYLDKRWREVDIDGQIGNDFLAKYWIAANWHEKEFYFRRRANAIEANKDARLARWKTGAFANCKNPGCITITRKGGAGTPATEPGIPVPPNVIVIEREAAAPKVAYEVVFKMGEGAASKSFVATIPNKTEPLTVVSSNLPSGAIQVVDISPFPRLCDNRLGDKLCIWPLN